MAFKTYEELKAAVEARREALLTLEVPINTPYSPEHEAAKQELATAKGMKALTGGAGFLGDNLEALEKRVAETRPETDSIWIRYRQVPLDEWGKLIRQQGLSPYDQYERVLPATFVGVFGEDPDPDEKPEGWEAPEPLTTDARSVSTRSGDALLPGGALHSVVQAFMSWQNSGGEVSIRPTKSGRV